MRWLRRELTGLMMLVAAILAMTLLTGCPNIEGLTTANPTSNAEFTQTKKDGTKTQIKFKNNKNEILKITKMSVDPETGVLTIEGLDANGDAATVRHENANQIDAMTRQVQAQWVGINAFTTTLVNGAISAIPMLSRPAAQQMVDSLPKQQTVLGADGVPVTIPGIPPQILELLNAFVAEKAGTATKPVK